MLTFKQWWFRGVRAGCALVQLSMLRSNPIRSKIQLGIVAVSLLGVFAATCHYYRFCLDCLDRFVRVCFFYLLQIVRIQYKFKSQGKRVVVI